MENKIIIKPVWIVLIIAIQIILFTLSIRHSRNNSSNLETVNKDTRIPPTKITRYSNRGAIYINDTLILYSNCPVISSPKRFKQWTNTGPIVDFDTSAYTYKLEDLAIPYVLSKEKNSDTIIVSKNNMKLEFLLIK